MNNHTTLCFYDLNDVFLEFQSEMSFFFYVNLPYVRNYEKLCAPTEIINVSSLETSYDSKKILKSAEHFYNHH